MSGDEDRHSWDGGREQQVDPKRRVVVKKHHRWQAAAQSNQAAENYDRIFADKAPTAAPTEPEPSEDARRKQAFRDNFDAIFGAK